MLPLCHRGPPPDPRESLPMSSTAVIDREDEKGRQELRPRGPSSILPLNSFIKDSLITLTKTFRQQISSSINVLELKAVFLALRHFKDQCQDQTVLVATDNSTVVAYVNKQGGTHSVEMCALLWRIMTWFHRFHITLKARNIPGCLNVMADLSRSNQV